MYRRLQGIRLDAAGKGCVGGKGVCGGQGCVWGQRVCGVKEGGKMPICADYMHPPLSSVILHSLNVTSCLIRQQHIDRL